MTFEEFAQARLAAVLAFATVLTGQRATAEDLVQEVLIRAHARWDTIGRLDRPELYVRKMVLNEFLSWRRRSWRLIPAGDGELHLPSAPDHAAGYAEHEAMLAEIAEDDVRAALRVLADDAPDPSAVLSALPPATQPGLGTRRARHDGRLSRVVAPVAAAAAVIAVVATSIAIGTGGHRGVVVTPAAPVHGSGLPPYYVVITQPPGRSGLVTTVRDTRTGASLATVRPPRGYWFIGAGPGADNDSFLLEANQHSEHPGLYLLRFNPADRDTSLTRLPIAVTLDAHELAMSPSGTEVAVASGTNTGRIPSKLQIYTLSGRLIRQWQSPGHDLPRWRAGVPVLGCRVPGVQLQAPPTAGVGRPWRALRGVRGVLGGHRQADRAVLAIGPVLHRHRVLEQPDGRQADRHGSGPADRPTPTVAARHPHRR